MLPKTPNHKINHLIPKYNLYMLSLITSSLKELDLIIILSPSLSKLNNSFKIIIR